MPTLEDIIRGEDAVTRNTVMVLDAFYNWMDAPKRETTMPKLDMGNITDDQTERLIVLARAIVSNWTRTGPFDQLAAAVRDMGALLDSGEDGDTEGMRPPSVDHMPDDKRGAPADEATQLQRYRLLHDGLSDMIEGERLTEDMIPDDYQWLVERLASLEQADESSLAI